jgi:hypothetical protein
MTIIQAGYVAQWLGANGVMDQRGAAALWGIQRLLIETKENHNT